MTLKYQFESDQLAMNQKLNFFYLISVILFLTLLNYLGLFILNGIIIYFNLYLSLYFWFFIIVLEPKKSFKIIVFLTVVFIQYIFIQHFFDLISYREVVWFFFIFLPLLQIICFGVFKSLKSLTIKKRNYLNYCFFMVGKLFLMDGFLLYHSNFPILLFITLSLIHI